MHLTLKGSYNEVSLKRVELFVAGALLEKHFFTPKSALCCIFINIGLRKMDRANWVI